MSPTQRTSTIFGHLLFSKVLPQFPENMAVHKARDLCFVYTIHPLTPLQTSRQTLANPIKHFQHLEYRDFSNRINASCRLQSFLPSPQPSTSSRPPYLHAVQTSILTRRPDLHTCTPSRPPYLASIPTQPPYLQVSRPLRLHDFQTCTTCTTSTNPRPPRLPHL